MCNSDSSMCWFQPCEMVLGSSWPSVPSVASSITADWFVSSVSTDKTELMRKWARGHGTCQNYTYLHKTGRF